MDSARRTAVTVGVLFIVATGFFMLGQTMYAPLLDGPDYLQLAHPQRARIAAGLLIELVGVLAIPLIAIFLFPILRAQSEGLALSYVGLRVLEAVPLLAVSGNMFSLLDVSERYLADGETAAAQWQSIGTAIQMTSESTFLLSVGIVFPVGALILYSMLFRNRLVPRFISGWGFLAAALLLVGTILDVFAVFAGLSPTIVEAVLALPIAIQEMVLAVWLIAKGFHGERLRLLRGSVRGPVPQT